MATVRTTIKNAFRKSGVVALGGSVSATQSAQGLELIKELYDTLIQEETLGRLEPVLAASAYEGKEWERVYRKDGTVVVTFPVTITDGGYSTERAPYDGAVIMAVGPAGATPDTRIYDARTATWEAVESLTLGSNAPLSNGNKTDLEALLAAAILAENDFPITAVLTGEIRTAKYHLARKKQRRNRPAQMDII